MTVIPCKNFEQYQREKMRRNSQYPQLWQWLDQVKDPEIPVLSLWDMGILKNVEQLNKRVVITITPTYSGCPAMDVIKEDIEKVLHDHGVNSCLVKTELAPAWTTDWMTEKGRQQLREFGIAAPDDVITVNDVSANDDSTSKQDADQILSANTQVRCPHCGSHDTYMVSEFGSTACKALFQCHQCSEPFDLFKKI